MHASRCARMLAKPTTRSQHRNVTRYPVAIRTPASARRKQSSAGEMYLRCPLVAGRAWSPGGLQPKNELRQPRWSIERPAMATEIATDDVTDTIARIEMHRQVATKEAGLAVSCSE